MKKMRITIKTDGTTTMKVEGAEGETCLDFTRAFETALGKVEKRVMHEESETASEDIHIYDEPAT
jgi:hypothetical protein